MNTKKKILLLGGTGAMGAYLVELLSQRDDVLCYVTSRSSRSDLANIKYLQGNAQDSTFLHKILDMHPWDCVVDFMVYSTEQFRERANLLLQSTKQYIFISSARVYADSDGQLTEESPRLLDVCTDQEYLNTDEYALTKARQEDILINSTFRNWTILRPSKTYGSLRIQLGSQEKEIWLYDALHDRSVTIPKDVIDKYVTFSSGMDAAKCIEKAIDCNLTLGEIYNITGDLQCTWREVLGLYTGVFNSFNKNLKIKVLDQWEPWQGGSYYQVKYSTALNRKVCNDKIKTLFPDLVFDDGKEDLKRILSNFIQCPKFGIVGQYRIIETARYLREFPSFKEITSLKKKIKLLLIKLNII